MDESRVMDQRVHDAYERIALDDEAQERMLGRLLAAQAERDGAAGDAGADASLREVPGVPDEVATPRRARKAPRMAGRRIPLWLPLAAAAACVFVAVGVFGGATGSLEAHDAVTAGESAKSVGETSNATSLDEEQDAAAEEVALDEMAENLAAAPDATADEAEQMQQVDLYPRVVLEDGRSFTTLVDGMYTTQVEAEAVGALVGVGTAGPFDAEATVPCEVFELLDEPDAFAVRYEGESTYWHCTKL